MKVIKSMTALWLILVVGWLINIIIFVKSFTTLGEVTGFQIIQVIGIFTGPVGSVLGYLSLFI